MNKVRLIRPWQLAPERQPLNFSWQPVTDRKLAAVSGPQLCEDTSRQAPCEPASRHAAWPPAEGPRNAD